MKKIVLLLVLALTLIAGDYEDAVEALKKGDYKNAVKLYKKAAEQGNSSAQSDLGMMYLQGDHVLKDPNMAVYWLEKSSKQDNATGQFNFAVMYCMGRGVRKDLKQCAYWTKKAYENGEDVSNFWEQYELWKYQ